MRLISHSGFVKLCTLNLSEAWSEGNVFGGAFIWVLGWPVLPGKNHGNKNNLIHMAS